MEKTQGTLRRALTSGTVAGITTAIAASLAGKHEDGSYAAPLNAVSHILWGDKAARKDNASLKYTVTGILLNHASAIFWALFYEKWFGQRGANCGTRAPEPRSLVKPILGAAAVTAGSYIIDYYLIPKRFTPGFEKRLSGKSLATVFGILAAGLVACDLIDAAKSRRR
ncbi:MAG: hypothetical protein M3Q16_06680 [Pseudomonadota bacterium]|nr:hypothetical protein [Pseudomonadota bacterium]